MRTAHYIRSAHWDREWYEPFQGYRMRLVSMLDEALHLLAHDPTFIFTMDGQSIPIHDYLEIRPEQTETVKQFIAAGRLKIGPWYVAPDEWLVCGESLIRNLQRGMADARHWGHPSSHAGFVCDQFGHIGQLPQIFSQLGIGAAYIWRGTNERDHHGHFLWQSPDGTALPTYRFGKSGYGMLAYRVRDVFNPASRLNPAEAITNLVEYTRYEAARSNLSPILLFDGCDHLEPEPQMTEIIAAANQKLAADNIRIQPSDLDTYQAAILAEREKIERKIIGELRDTCREPAGLDEQWLIAGCYSSRIHLKQQNALCEDELCLWAEPFSTFATHCLARQYPAGFLNQSWKHLLENHPHDSICGCSIDQVHQDMLYRFDQSLLISQRLTTHALRAITIAAAPALNVADSFLLGIFNAGSADLDEPIDLEIPLPKNWPTKHAEFFGFEEKFTFRLKGPLGEEIPYQLVHQRRDAVGFRIHRYKLPAVEHHHLINITAKIKVPAFGYTTLIVEPHEGPTRYLGSLAVSHRSAENEFLKFTINPNGTLNLHDKRTGHTFDQLLTFEDRADIGDGWFHGVAINDSIHTTAAAFADVSTLADGINKTTLRIDLTMNLPAAFDFKRMVRSEQKTPLRIVSDVTLRAGCDRLEITTTVHNTVRDHRLRVLNPSGLSAETYLCDNAFDVVERPVALVPDNAIRRELDIETRPQISWTAFGDGKTGLALVSRGLPESAVINSPDKPIALTLLRSFRKVVFSDESEAAQIQGAHVFHYEIIPFAGDAPREKLFLRGQRVNGPTRQMPVFAVDLALADPIKLPRAHSFVAVAGGAVVTSIQPHGENRLIRLFNPSSKTITVKMQGQSAQAISLADEANAELKLKTRGDQTEVEIPAKRIVTLLIKPGGS